jgi:hypothetical protein
MAVNISNQSIQKTPVPKQDFKGNIFDRKGLTSPLLCSSPPTKKHPKGKLEAIFRRSADPIGYSYSQKLVTPTEPGEQPYWETIRVEDHGPNVVILQKALYLVFTEYYRLQGKSIDYDLKHTYAKAGWKPNLCEGRFTGTYDKETELYVYLFQQFNNIPYVQSETLNTHGITNHNVIAKLDIELEKIKYYHYEDGPNSSPNTSDHHTFIYHNNSLATQEEKLTVANQSNAKVYKLPEQTSSVIATLTPLISKVYVIQDIEQYRPGWVYVQVDFESAETSHGEHGMYGYVERSKLLMRSSMPDKGAIAKYVVPGESVYSIINNHYYNGVGVNDNGYVLRTESYTIPILPGILPADLLGVPINRKEANLFKFYVNLLLFANNKYGILPPGQTEQNTQEAIYLTYSGSNIYNASNWTDIYESKNPYNNSNTFVNAGTEELPEPQLSNYSNYEYFLDRLKDTDNGFHWDWDETGGGINTIKILHSKHIWIPSKKFADSLYAQICQDADYLRSLAETVRKTIRDNWPRGFGVEIEGSIGATFGYPIRLEAGGSVHLYRKYTESHDDIIICLKKSGRIKAGVDIGVGAGFYMGSGTKKKPDYGVGLQVGANAGAGIEVDCDFEYEFIIDSPSLNVSKTEDTAALALAVSVFSTGNPVIEFAAVEFLKAFSDYNIDPANFLTRFNMRGSTYTEGSAGAIAGLYFGSQDDVDYWVQNEQAPTADPVSPPWHMRRLMSLLNASLGADASTSLGMGYEYKAVYNDYTGSTFNSASACRLPKRFTQTLYTDASFSLNVSGNLSLLIGGDIVAIQNFVAFKLVFEYERVVFLNQTTNKYQYRFDRVGSPKIIALGGSGNWDDYENSASELAVVIKTNVPAPISALDLLDFIESFKIRKRFKIVHLGGTNIKELNTMQDYLKRYFVSNKKYKKFGAEAGAYIDLEATISFEAFVNDVIPKLVAVLTELRAQIARNKNVAPGTITWLEVISNFGNYLNLLKTPAQQKNLSNLYQALLAIFTIDLFAFHGEVSFGAAIGFRAAVGFKVAFDARMKFTITYDQAFISNGEWIIPDGLEYDHAFAEDKKLVQDLQAILTNQQLVISLLKFGSNFLPLKD